MELDWKARLLFSSLPCIYNLPKFPAIRWKMSSFGGGWRGFRDWLHMLENKLSITITDAQIAAARQALADFKTALPFLISLSNAERKTLPKISSGSEFFVSDGLEAAATNPEFMPPYVDIAELQRDGTAYAKLAPLAVEAEQILGLLNDTTITLGSEAYVAVLAYYGSLKNASKHGVAGAKAIYDKLKLRFQNNGPAKPPAA